ncbi:Uncharacterized protein dnl_09870 [Desulfonema limicola]|uniref:Uncharacterized protein n=1 Tax=Desulfonema limicola TaxID=45656 RepID=A0A975B4R1_9BACT|nr:hypothetical protein [Desulfonema limicola]QTA78754.1 Uncharacterized protein dnl_09870 [Desulfonema limicola]
MNDKQKLYPHLIYRINQILTEIQMSLSMNTFIDVFSPYKRVFYYLLVDKQRWEIKYEELLDIKKIILENNDMWEIFESEFQEDNIFVLSILEESFETIKSSDKIDDFHFALSLIHQFYPQHINSCISGVIIRNLMRRFSERKNNFKIDYAYADLLFENEESYILYPWAKMEFFCNDDNEIKVSCQEVNKNNWYPPSGFEDVNEEMIEHIPKIESEEYYLSREMYEYRSGIRYTPATNISNHFHQNYILPFFTGYKNFDLTKFYNHATENFIAFRYTLILVIYDAIIHDELFGNIIGVLHIVCPNKTMRRQFVGTEKNKITKLFPVILKTIKESASYEILQQPISESEDFLEHFIKYLPFLQDWEGIMVWKKNFEYPVYCYQRNDSQAWYKCNRTDCKNCIKPHLRNQIRQFNEKDVHLQNIEFSDPNRTSSIRIASAANLLNKKFIPNLYDEDQNRYNDCILVFEYPVYTIIPEDEEENNRLWLHYKREQIDLLRQLALQRKIVVETIRHGTNAAVAAIMSRNMAHNIGSHVLSYLVDEYDISLDSETELSRELFSRLGESIVNPLVDLVVNKCLPKENQKERDLLKASSKKPAHNRMQMGSEGLLSFIQNNRYLFKYLKDRMDFIATVLTYIPFSSTLDFARDFVGWDITDGDKTLISKSRDSINFDADQDGIFQKGSAYLFEDLNLMLHFINFSEKINGQNISRDKLRIYLKTKKTHIPVSVPGGVIGKQAFYTIIENIIRNAAKHGIHLLRDEQRLTFSIELPDEDNELHEAEYDKNDLLRVTITDNIGNVENQLSSIPLHEKLQKKLEENIVNNSGKLERKNLGLKEMKVSAAFLRGIEPTAIYGNEIIGWSDNIAKKLIHADCNEKGKLRFSFFLLKPKHIIIFTDNENHWEINPEFKEYGIDILQRDSREMLNFIQHHKDRKLRHRFIIHHGDRKCTEVPDEDFLPRRVIEIDHPQSIFHHSGSPGSFFKAVYEKWIKDFYEIDSLPVIYLPEELSKKDEWNINRTEKSVRSLKYRWTDPPQTKKILYCSHLPEELPNLKNEAEDIGFSAFTEAGNAHNFIFIDSITGGDSSKSRLYNPVDSELLRLELIESALTRVLIIDERLFEISLRRSNAEIMDLKGIHIWNLNISLEQGLGFISQTSHDSTPAGKIELDSGHTIYYPIEKPYHFISIHQGIIDKIIENCNLSKKPQYIKKVLDSLHSLARFHVIHSGRGSTEYIPKGWRFMTYSELENLCNDDKCAMVQGLYSVIGR